MNYCGFAFLYMFLFCFKVFEGNSDGDTVVSHWLVQPVRACFCRLQPKTWNEQIALRLELYGKLVSGNTPVYRMRLNKTVHII